MGEIWPVLTQFDSSLHSELYFGNQSGIVGFIIEEEVPEGVVTVLEPIADIRMALSTIILSRLVFMLDLLDHTVDHQSLGHFTALNHLKVKLTRSPSGECELINIPNPRRVDLKGQ